MGLVFSFSRTVMGRRAFSSAAVATAVGCLAGGPLAAAGTLVRLQPLVPDPGLPLNRDDGRFVTFTTGGRGAPVIVRDTMLHKQSALPVQEGCYLAAIGGGHLAYDCDAPADTSSGNGLFVVTDLTGGDVVRGGYPGTNISVARINGVGAAWLRIGPGTDKVRTYYVNWRTGEARYEPGIRDLDSLDLKRDSPAKRLADLVDPSVRLRGRPLRVKDVDGHIRRLSLCQPLCRSVQFWGRRVTWLDGRNRRHIYSLDSNKTIVATPSSPNAFSLITRYEVIFEKRRAVGHQEAAPLTSLQDTIDKR